MRRTRRAWPLAAWVALLGACAPLGPAGPGPAPTVAPASVSEVEAAVAGVGRIQPGGSDVPPDQVRETHGERPRLDAAAAARMDVDDYLAEGPERWRPGRLPAADGPADLTVAPDGSGSHRSLQAAIDAVPERSADGRRVVIRLRPGVYRERVCVPAGKAPITLLGDATDASAVTVIGRAWGGQAKQAGVDAAHPCQPDLALPIVGTLGSATVIVAADDFQAAHLTIANDVLEGVRGGEGYPPGASESGGAQGVALTTQADRIQLEDLRLIGHQDTLQVRRPRPDRAARVLVRRSLIAGDVDFIFGSATLVVDDSTILSRGGRRRPPNGGHVLAPSTPAGVARGFLVTRSRFLAEPDVPTGLVSLGRAWDEGVARGSWQPGRSPNGQALVRDSLLGPHLALQAPWAASTSRRPFTASGPQAARMAEFRNIELTGAEPRSREVLSPWDGWAASAGGVTGGATAAPGDVHTVRTRAELVRALSPHGRPRIVQVAGRIDLSTDDAGRPLGAEDYRDPAFAWDRFLAAYDPQRWGRDDPRGAPEDARRRSARRQAEQVVLRVPSRTTLVGLGADAALVHGSLMLDGVEQVIIRHLHFSDAFDHFPAWEPRDNGHGEWNSEYDNVSLRESRHVWVDHCRFDDGQRLDDTAPVRFGRRVQHHDGLLDITNRSDRVTVSWNHFRNHEKAVLVGSGDGRTTDEGHLRVSFHHNLWQQVSERTPRVRYGQVHVHDNVFDATVPGPYRYVYSLGIGVASRLVSEGNVWLTPPEVPAASLARWFKGTRVSDRGSLHNGRPVDLLAALQARHPEASFVGDAGWVPWLVARRDPPERLAERVRAGVGPAPATPVEGSSAPAPRAP